MTDEEKNSLKRVIMDQLKEVSLAALRATRAWANDDTVETSFQIATAQDALELARATLVVLNTS